MAAVRSAPSDAGSVALLPLAGLLAACATGTGPERSAEPRNAPSAGAASLQPFEDWAWPADPALRSAGLVRDAGRDVAAAGLPPDVEIAELRRHFAAVDALLERDTRRSLDIALARLEAARGQAFTPAERARWRETLAASRALQRERLRAYAARGRFPQNPDVGGPTRPIFVDAADTACAVGFLMRESGWADEVAAIAASDNGIYVPDASGGPLVAWVLTSGLTQEEAALIQPGYTPPPPNVDVTSALAPDGSVEKQGLHLEALEIASDAFTAGSPMLVPGFEAFCYPTPSSFCTGTPLPGAEPDPALIDLAIGTDYESPDGGSIQGDFLFWNAASAGGFASADGTGFAGVRTQLRFDVSASDPGLGISGATLSSDGFSWDGAPNLGPDILVSMYVVSGDELLGSILLGDEASEFFDLNGDSYLDGFGELSFAPQQQVTVVVSGILQPGAEWNHFRQSFAMTAIPEPGTAALLGLGFVLLAVGRGRRAVRSA